MLEVFIMKKILAVVLALVLILSMSVAVYAAGSTTPADVEEVNAPAADNAGGAPAAGAAEQAKEDDSLKIEDGNGKDTAFDASEAVEDVDSAIAELKEEDAETAEVLEAFFEENKDNVGQGVVSVPEKVKEAVSTDTVLIPVKAKGVKVGDTVTVILIFPDGSTQEITVTCDKDGVIYIPVPVDAQNVGYVIKA